MGLITKYNTGVRGNEGKIKTKNPQTQTASLDTANAVFFLTHIDSFQISGKTVL